MFIDFLAPKNTPPLVRVASNDRAVIAGANSPNWRQSTESLETRKTESPTFRNSDSPTAYWRADSPAAARRVDRSEAFMDVDAGIWS